MGYLRILCRFCGGCLVYDYHVIWRCKCGKSFRIDVTLPPDNE